MLLEYAVEPKAIGSSWQNFRYLIEKFGFDRGRLISEFPKTWRREVYEAILALPEMDRARITEKFSQCKAQVLIDANLAFNRASGSWLENAIRHQRSLRSFHAIIAVQNPGGDQDVLTVDETDDNNPLMISPINWEVERVGIQLASAMRPLLRSAGKILFVDRFFNLENPRYKETLRSCLAVISAHGRQAISCEIHYGDHDKRAPASLVEEKASRWLSGVIPNGMSITLFCWKEKIGGADLHARHLLTDRGGINVESGFEAVGQHQKVLLSLLDQTVRERAMSAFSRESDVYELIEPILEVASDGRVQRVPK